MDLSPFGKTISIILVVVLIFLFPLPYIAKAVNKTVEDLVTTNMTELTDAMRQQGKITKEMYEDMIRELDRTGELYDIDIEVSHPVSGAEIKVTKLGDDMPDRRATNISHNKERLVVEEISEEEHHEGHNHEEEIKSFAANEELEGHNLEEEIRSFAANTHTEDCYAGHRHTSSCNYVYNVPAEGVSVFYLRATGYYWQLYSTMELRHSSQGLVFKFLDNHDTNVFSVTEYRNGSIYYHKELSYGTGTYGDPVYIKTRKQLYDCFLWYEASRRTNIPDDRGVGSYVYPGIEIPSQFTVSSCTLAQDETPICNRVVTSITPTNPNQTVNRGANIVTTATATYLDGHTATISCTSNFNPNQVGAQTVTLTYNGLVNNARTTGIKTCTVNVTVRDTLSRITASPASQEINRNQSPSFVVTAYYDSGASKQVTGYSISNLNNTILGTQTVTISYTENGITKTTTAIVIVKDPFKLSSLSVSPASQEVTRYQAPSFTVTAHYDNGTSKPVTGYSVSNYNSSLLGSQSVTISYTEGGITKTATVNVVVKNLARVCPVCHTSYYLDNNDIDRGCPSCNSTIISISASPDNIVLNKGTPLAITVEALYRNGKRSIVTGWTSDYDPSQIGIQDVTITYQTFTTGITVEVRNQLKTCSICSLEYELNNDGTDPGCPVCKTTVVRIEATPKVLTIHKHQALPITVKATFKDGHTEIINDWASNFMADTAGIFEVMIVYKNVMDLITVTVKEDGEVVCPYCGLTYLFNDSPKGCPTCYVTLTGIEAYLRGGGTKVPYNSKLNLEIVKIFKDEHRELTYTGWTVSGYNPSQLGHQTITAHYSGFSDQLDIEVVDELPEVTCPNGHTYYLNPDGSDPGCPYCNGAGDKAESLFYFNTTYTGFIMNELYTKGEYPLQKGDYLKIRIKPRNVSILSKLLKLFIGIIKTEYTFGGEVS